MNDIFFDFIVGQPTIVGLALSGIIGCLLYLVFLVLNPVIERLFENLFKYL